MNVNETGERVFFWYRAYCAAMALLYLVVTGFGIFLTAYKPESREYSTDEIMFSGLTYAVLGAVFFLGFAIAFFLPPTPHNWIVGMVMICIGLTSCCLLPACIPLLIYWIKPETKAFFGRN